MSTQLHRRILLRQLPLLTVLFVVVVFWLGRHLEGVLRSAYLETARRSNLLVVYAVEASMRAERSHDVWARVIQKVPRHGGTGIEIINTAGTVVFSTEAARRGLSRRLSDPLCSCCHQQGTSRAFEETTFIRDPDDDQYQVFAAPLRNGPECLACHRDDGEKLGMVLVRQSLRPIQGQVRTVQFAIGVAGAIALLLALVTSRLLLGRYLTGPLNKLAAGASAIGAGELETRIALSERTELKLLADTLNDSAARLSELVARLRRQRDESQTLYRLADQLSRGVFPEQRRQRAVQLASEMLRAECVLIRPPAGTDSVHPDAPPDFYSRDLVERWLQGELAGQTEVVAGNTIAHPLERSGRTLGLLLRPRLDDPETDPEMVQALCRHIAIALEFSDLQRELLEEERLAAIGETVAGLAHWLKNTLNGLRAGQYVVDRGVELGDTSKIQKGWRVMRKSIRQVEKLTADVLYCARERTPEFTVVDPNAIVLDVVESMNDRASEQGVELAVELGSKTGPTCAERDSIHRALLNLVSNAIDACTESEHGDHVTLRCRRVSTEIMISVQDNGAGMSEELQRRLFSRFFSTKGSRGTGLGLMVVKKIIEEHRGRIEVTSNPGAGSTFSLYLPASD